METDNDTLITMPVGRLLLKFSLPAIGGMIINSLYNLVDRIFVGRIGALAMTGIGLSLPFMMLLSAVSSLVGIGPQRSFLLSWAKKMRMKHADYLVMRSLYSLV